MSDYWPIPDIVRQRVINHTCAAVITAENPRHALAACRLLLMASMLNLRNRLLPPEFTPRIKPPPGTRREYERHVASDTEYLDYLHDWAIHKAGYPEGYESHLRYLPFKIVPWHTPQGMYDPEKDNLKRYWEEENKKPLPSWEDYDLWPIKPALREPAMNRVLRIIAQKEDMPLSLAATRTLMQASSINLRYRKAQDIKPPSPPPPPPHPDERDFFQLEFFDAQYDQFLRDRELREQGYPAGDTFRWRMSPKYISNRLVNWKKIDFYMNKHGHPLEDGEGEPLEIDFKREALQGWADHLL